MTNDYTEVLLCTVASRKWYLCDAKNRQMSNKFQVMECNCVWSVCHFGAINQLLVERVEAVSFASDKSVTAFVFSGKVLLTFATRSPVNLFQEERLNLPVQL